jgi:site-specific DNA-cytosine methylase
MENVKEFLHWGPTEPVLKDGEFQYWPDGTMKRVPIKAKKGQTFKVWLGRLKAMGYAGGLEDSGRRRLWRTHAQTQIIFGCPL